MKAEILALTALVPLMAGTGPARAGDTITAALCDGGTVTIPLNRKDRHEPAPCHPKGCHGGACRNEAAKKKGARGKV